MEDVFRRLDRYRGRRVVGVGSHVGIHRRPQRQDGRRLPLQLRVRGRRGLQMRRRLPVQLRLRQERRLRVRPEDDGRRQKSRRGPRLRRLWRLLPVTTAA
jgi:hypothetical protein